LRTSALIFAASFMLLGACARDAVMDGARVTGTSDAADAARAEPRDITDGQGIFRFDTFGDETFWTDTLRIHEVIESAVDPVTALAVGLKIDADALPLEMRTAFRTAAPPLDDPETTVKLLKLNAVVGLQGVVGKVGGRDTLLRVGTTCALCHSTVDNSLAPGAGKRLDGWPNLDLDPGAIIALSPALTPAQKAVYNSWGPGKYDPRFNVDGINGPVVIPPAYGLRGIHRSTYTGDGEKLMYWNRYVAVTQMHGHGAFSDPRLPLFIDNRPPDLVSDKLPALQAYQLSIAAPPPPPGSFDPAAAARGRLVFQGAGGCATCHSGVNYTDANRRLHPSSDVVSLPEPNGAPDYSTRTATKMWRTTPLRALWQHAPYFHNGVAPTLDAVVDLYDSKKGLGLTAQQKADLVQYLKSL
jgi:hypothetical protein